MDIYDMKPMKFRDDRTFAHVFAGCFRNNDVEKMIRIYIGCTDKQKEDIRNFLKDEMVEYQIKIHAMSEVLRVLN